MKHFLTVLIFSMFFIGTTTAQFFVGPFAGFKASSLKGALKAVDNGQVQVLNVVDAGATGFSAGVTIGYQVIPPGTAGGIYKLDVTLDASWSSFSFFENAWDDLNGSGSFTANGLDGGKTNMFSFDIMPIHRFNFKGFILSPFAGLGFGLNLLMTSDITTGPPGFNPGTFIGSSEMKMGLLVFYGTVFKVSKTIQPYIHFKHLIPFGDETEFIESWESSQGQGTQNLTISVADVPGYFSIAAGVRFSF